MSSSEGRPPPTDRRADRPLIVEFIGTPGAGKTTVSSALVGLLQAQGREAATVLGAAREHAGRTVPGRAIARLAPTRLRRPLLWQVFYLLGVLHAFGFSRDHPALLRQVVRHQLGRPISTAARRHILFWFFQLAGRYRFLAATSRHREALVLDDGFLHRSVHLHASHVEAPQAERVTAYVDLLPRPDLVVLVAAARQVCERRVRERGVWPHSRHLSPAELSRYLVNAEQAVRLAVRRARERGWTVLEIDNSDRELGRVTCDLRGALEPLLGVA